MVVIFQVSTIYLFRTIFLRYILCSLCTHISSIHRHGRVAILIEDAPYEPLHNAGTHGGLNTFSPKQSIPRFDFEDGLRGEAANLQFEQAEGLLELQVNLIKKLIAYRLFEPPSKKEFESIRQFLANQQADAPQTAFTFTFWNENYIGAQIIRAENCDEFDFADAWAELQYTLIGIEAIRWKGWTGLRTKKMLEHIKGSFADSGIPARISIMTSRHAKPADSTLVVGCKVRGG